MMFVRKKEVDEMNKICTFGLFFAIGFSDVSDSYKNDRGSSVSLGHGQEAFCLIQIGL